MTTIKALHRQAGFTLPEILMAAAIIGVGLVGVSAGLLYATGGIEAGRQQTTAAFLAEQRLEQIKNQATSSFSLVTTATFPGEAYGTIANAPNYRRAVAITDAPNALTDTKLVTVTVFYRPVAGWRVYSTEREVRVSTLIADRK